CYRAQGRLRIIAPLDPNERRRSFYHDDIDRWRMPSRSREIQQAGSRESAVNLRAIRVRTAWHVDKAHPRRKTHGTAEAFKRHQRLVELERRTNASFVLGNHDPAGRGQDFPACNPREYQPTEIDHPERRTLPGEPASGRGFELMERCCYRAQGRLRIIAPLDPNERRRSFYRDDIDRWRMPSRSREIQQAGSRESAVNYVPFCPDPYW
ncbi:MAG: hypothetical protein ACI9UA_005389, partial [Pseudoalteromonas tetraodonis]